MSTREYQFRYHTLSDFVIVDGKEQRSPKLSRKKVWATVIDERMDGCIDGRMDGRMDGWMDGWMDGYMDGWMDGWMDG